MPIGYLDVPPGAGEDTKAELMTAMYEALKEAYPFPDDTRIFIREWPVDSISQNGAVAPDPVKPVFMAYVPQGADPEARRRMLTMLDAAVTEAYGLPEFVVFLHEHPLDLIAVDGTLLADDQQRVEDQARAYS